MDYYLIIILIIGLFFLPVPVYLLSVTVIAAFKEILTMRKNPKAIVFLIVYFAAICLISAILVRRLSIKSVDLIIFNPFLPIGLYLATILLNFGTMLQPVEYRIHPILNQKMNTNLILAGFCFTSLSFLFSLLKDDINPYKNAFLFFIIALGLFLVSYFLLHFKVADLFISLAEASTDSGLWCMILGLFHLFKIWKGLELISFAITILLIIFGGCLIFNFILDFIERRR